jgi:hypothetical protein
VHCQTLLSSKQEAEHTAAVDTSANAVESKADAAETKTSDSSTGATVEEKTKETDADVDDDAKAALGVKPAVLAVTTDETTSNTAAIDASGNTNTKIC